VYVSEAGRQASARLWRMRSVLWASVVETKLRRLERAFKANFDSNQPRVPAGNPDGGQWIGSGGGGSERVAQMPPRGGRGRGTEAEATPAQLARRDIAEARAGETLRRVRDIDPTWSPRQSLTAPNSVEGQIARAQAIAVEAEARLRELARQPAESLIDSYRQQQGLDLLGEPVWSRDANSVALCTVVMKCPTLAPTLRR
jgi:hypothetical protein